jgi:hypothetical protein
MQTLVASMQTPATALSSTGLMGDFGKRLFEPNRLYWASCRLPPIKASNARKSSRGCRVLWLLSYGQA